MKWFKKARILACTLVLTMIFPMAVSAATYRDVPSTHYAYAAVDWVSNPANGSFMVGDASNNFNPTRTLDKFETAKIFAVAAGYKYSTTSTTPAEQEVFDKSYEMWKSLLDSLSLQYAKWSKTADREIAYLLYKNILTSADVSQFVVKSNGVEQVGSLTKQEAIVYMLRLDSKQANAEAISLPYHTPYKDDALIRADYKKYIYYAKEIGLAGGSDGYINPTRAITRAEIAQMFYNMLAGRQITIPAATTTPVNNSATTSISGVIDSLYLDTHVFITSGSTPQVYKLASNAVIVIDNMQRSAAYLVKGMNVNGLVNANNELVSLVARTAVTTEQPAVTTPPTNLSEDEGYVTAVSSLTGNAVTIKTQRVKLTGEIVSEEKNYTLATGCTIKRGSKDVAFSDIKANDIIGFTYNGAVLYSITLQEKDRIISGTLMERKYVDLTGTPVLVIEDDKHVKYELRVTSTTYFVRGNTRNLTWSDIRIGDEIEAQCEYDKLIAVYARGYRSTISGTLDEIHITQNSQQVVLQNSDRTYSTYTISAGTFDVYTLRVGMELKLYLDSAEVYDVVILSYPTNSTTSIVGYIQSLKSGNTLVIVDSDSASANSYTVKVDNNTLDTATGKALDFNKLRINMYVYIVFTSSNSNVAKSLTQLP